VPIARTTVRSTPAPPQQTRPRSGLTAAEDPACDQRVTAVPGDDIGKRFARLGVPVTDEAIAREEWHASRVISYNP
jgi:hypothetical protein